MEVLQDIGNILNWGAKNIPWDALLASGILSPLLVGIKKWLDVQSERVMITLVGVSGLLTAAVQYLMTAQSTHPGIIAMQGFILAFMTQPVYFFVVKPFLRWFGKQVEAAAELKLAQSATVPAEGLPVVEPKPVITDVSPMSAKVEDFTY